jgi:nicotinate-nucleotide pyrophosphorylase (carboxylating)
MKEVHEDKPAENVKSQDLRDIIFEGMEDKEVTASIRVKEEGIVSGITEMVEMAKKLGLDIVFHVPEGTKVTSGDVVAIVRGTPKQVVIAEDFLIGLIAKPSGIATAARKALELSQGKVTVVSGAWKKMPFQIKDLIRKALMVGGVKVRISEEPFLYLDKNYIRIFGGIEKAMEYTKNIKDRIRVVQIRGETDSIENEAVKAAECGANIIFVDTGNIIDLERVARILTDKGLRQRVKLAFGGSIKLEDIPKLREKDVDILDIGRAILDAPMLDMSFDVYNSG